MVTAQFFEPSSFDYLWSSAEKTQVIEQPLVNPSVGLTKYRQYCFELGVSATLLIKEREVSRTKPEIPEE